MDNAIICTRTAQEIVKAVKSNVELQIKQNFELSNPDRTRQSAVKYYDTTRYKYDKEVIGDMICDAFKSVKDYAFSVPQKSFPELIIDSFKSTFLIHRNIQGIKREKIFQRECNVFINKYLSEENHIRCRIEKVLDEELRKIDPSKIKKLDNYPEERAKLVQQHSESIIKSDSYRILSEYIKDLRTLKEHADELRRKRI